jgi:hypothetical protein
VKRYSFSIGLILTTLLVLLIMWHLKRMTAAPVTVGPASIKARTQERAKYNPIRTTAQQPKVEAGSDPILHLLGGTVPAEAQPYLIRAVQCAQIIEKERQVFSSNSGGPSQLDGLQRKLFMEDYAYAALATGKLDASQAGAAYEKLSANLKASPVAPSVTPVKDPLPVDQYAADKLNAHYMTMFGSENDSYSNVWRAVSSFSPNATQTDLFMDALAYAALRCEAATWIETEKQHCQETLARMAKTMDDPARSAVAMKSYSDLSNNEVNDLMLLQEAYRHVFAFRFANNHGLDPIPIMPVLDKIIVHNIGPELVIPQP